MRSLICLFVLALTTAPAWAQSKPVDPREAYERGRQRALRLTQAGARYLLSVQEQDGGWGSHARVGVSALILKALIQEPTVGPTHPAVERGLRFIVHHRRDDGGIYSAEGQLKNYESSVVLSMLAVLPGRPYAGEVAALQKFLKDLQWDEGEDKSPDDPWYGGAGYGAHQRPDLSNTQMMLEALHDSGMSQDDPVYQKALIFIQRCQMLAETNDLPLARGSIQGGFIYTPADGGESKAGTVAVDGRQELRCYGSMTYAGLKSMLYAGLKRDDVRVQAAVDWIRRHWTLDANPNLPDQQSREGLYYYYHVFARACAAWGEDLITDHAGRQHAWRLDLYTTLATRQNDDGSWVNEADRWMEGLPALVTAYSLLALQAAYPPSR